jgi:cold shock CspA family protein
MSEKLEAARLVAKLLAARRTPLEEVPQVIVNVHRALSRIGEETPAAPAPRASRIGRLSRKHAAPQPEPTPVIATIEVEPKAIQPTLVRRATLIANAPPAATPIFAPAPTSVVRGVVQWFDSRTGQGTLRLPGMSRDVPVDSAMLSAFGIARLFKGQEIQATLEGAGDQTRIAALHLANAASTSPITGGTVHDRHAKAVVVELKREAQRRSAARAEAELLLPTRSVP